MSVTEQNHTTDQTTDRSVLLVQRRDLICMEPEPSIDLMPRNHQNEALNNSF